jgi:hypothetical protein
MSPLREKWQLATVLSGGTILAVGAGGGDDGQIVLAEYSSDGSLDTSFGSGGISTLDIYGAYQATIVGTSGGEIKVGAYATGAISCVVVAEFQSDGTVDNSYGPGGYYVIDMSYDPYAMMMLSNGDTVVVGWANHHGLFAAEYDTGT